MSATVHRLHPRKERPLTATGGEYGAVAYNRVALYAQAMLRAIDIQLPDAAFFTREDLLHLDCFAHVATITRYKYVCDAVRYAVDRKWMLQVSTTELILSGRKRDYLKAVNRWEEFYDTVFKLVPPAGTTFSVVSILAQWNTDQHLTTNSKRTIIRNVVKRLVASKSVRMVEFNVYERQ